VSVVPVSTGSEQGFTFWSDWQVSGAHTTTADFGYTITDLGKLMDDAVLTITVLGHRDPATVAGSAGSASLYVFSDISSSKLTDFATFAGTHSLSVHDALSVGGSGVGSQKIASMFNGFSETTPEPAALTLFGTGLVALAGMVRRKKS
jgi:hypothetical protein